MTQAPSKRIVDRRRVAALACILIVSTAFSHGCGPDPKFAEGLKAEKLGEPYLAYEDYCQAARKAPGDGGVAAGIKRTAPAAAAHYQAAALKAMSEERYADTWRILMRVLEIRPDDLTTVKLIRQLQHQHAAEIDDARADWLRRGSAGLASALPEPARPSATQPALKGTAIARADSSAAPERRPPPALGEVKKAAPEVRGSMIPDDQETITSSDAQRKSADRNEGAEPQLRHHGQVASPAQADRRQDVIGLRGEAEHSAARPTPAQKPDEPDSPAGPEGVVSAVSYSAERQVVQGPMQSPQGLLTFRTLSKKDKRFAEQALLIDGIAVRLKGTEDDPEADLDLFDGKKRIKKIRGIRIGGSQTFSGRSGNDYRLVVLAIHHKTQTVRVGVQGRLDPAQAR